MSPINDGGSHFSNPAELVRLRGRNFPTPDLRSLFKLNRQSHLRSPLLQFFIIPTKTNIIRHWKISLLLLGFLILRLEKSSPGGLPELLYSYTRFERRAKSYHRNHTTPGIRGFRLNLLTDGHFTVRSSKFIRPHIPTRAGRIPTLNKATGRSTRLFKSTSPKSRPCLDAGANYESADDQAGDPALASRRGADTLT